MPNADPSLRITQYNYDRVCRVESIVIRVATITNVAKRKGGWTDNSARRRHNDTKTVITDKYHVSYLLIFQPRVPQFPLVPFLLYRSKLSCTHNNYCPVKQFFLN